MAGQTHNKPSKKESDLYEPIRDALIAYLRQPDDQIAMNFEVTGLGTAALSIPLLLRSSAIPMAAAGRNMVFRFMNFSDGKGGLKGKSIFMEGGPSFGSSGPVTGTGGYVIADTATFSVVSDFGTWRATNFVSFTNVGKVAAGFMGGTLTMDVLLLIISLIFSVERLESSIFAVA